MSKTSTTADDGNDHKGFQNISENISSRSRLVANAESISSGIAGLDKILGGGYLCNRASVIRGDSGTGKTVFALLFATAGNSDDAAVYASFDESVQNLETYVRDFPNQAKVHFLDFTPSTDSVGSGAENIELGGMLVRLRHACQQSGAKKLVLDALDVLFMRYEKAIDVRDDVYRIFSWCQENGITVLATAGVDRSYAKSRGVLDYASDCTLFLEQEINQGIMTRYLRVLKMRGRSHGTNVYPFLIDDFGISVMPITVSSLEHNEPTERLSLGVDGIDAMLNAASGVFRESITLISGYSGSGKTLLAVAAAHASSQAGLRVLYISLEQPPAEIVRDAHKVGMELQPFIDKGLLKVSSIRAVELGIEEHIILLLRQVETFGADVLVVDPISSLAELGTAISFKNMVIRLTQALREWDVTVIFTELWYEGAFFPNSYPLSSLVDTWIKLFYEREGLSMHRRIMVAKSRGTGTSDRIKNLEISDEGILIS